MRVTRVFLFLRSSIARDERIAELSSQVEWAIKNDKREYALELLNEVGEKLKERNKHLRIADSSPGGWDTVNNYISNPIASDSEDDSKINRAENKAIKKRKLSKPNKGKDRGNFSTTASNAVFNSISSDVSGSNSYWRGNTATMPRINPAFQFQQQANARSFRVGGCFNCGDFTHFRRECPYLPIKTATSTASAATQGKQIFKKWSDWVIANGLQKNDALPAKPIVVGLIQNGSSVSTLTNAFYSINRAHKVIDVPSPLDSELVRNVFDAGKRQLSVPKITGSNAIT
ncbi:hypothetical protein KUTeg_004752 [Tegillarca granosa]|uniref:CCHC-type domain-containing protein n=1 Tax=Tegillarca granosa TaxID=220873 RepID=A0ABQ9FHR6_TEGGR|nr:hypothetical protein KUTeg_004752 [Tegillarca granosa]